MAGWSDDDDAWTAKMKAKKSQMSANAKDSDPWSDEEPAAAAKSKKKPVVKAAKPAKKAESDWSEDDDKFVPAPSPKKVDKILKKKVEPAGDEAWSDDEPVVVPQKKTKPKKPVPVQDEWSEEEKPKKKAPKPVKNKDDWSEEEAVVPKKSTRSVKPEPKSKNKKNAIDDEFSKDEVVKTKPVKKASKPQPKDDNSDWSEEEKPKPKISKPVAQPISKKPAPKKTVEADTWSDDDDKRTQKPVKKPPSKPVSKPKPAAVVDDWSDDDVKPPKKPQSAKKPVAKPQATDDWSDDEPPAKPVKKQAAKKAPQPAAKDDWSSDEAPKKAAPKKVAKKPAADDDWSDSDEPKKSTAAAPKKVPKKVAKNDDWSEDEEPSKKPTKRAAKKTAVDDRSEDDKPRPAKKASPVAKKPAQKQQQESDDGWSDDAPAIKPVKKSAPPPTITKKAQEPPKRSPVKNQVDSDGWSESEDDQPKKPAKTPQAPPKRQPIKKQDSGMYSDDEQPKKSSKQPVSPNIKEDDDAWSESEVSMARPKKTAPKLEKPPPPAVKPATKPAAKAAAKPAPVKENSSDAESDDAWGSDSGDKKTDKKKSFKKKKAGSGFGSDDDSKSLVGSGDESEKEREPVTYVPEYDAHDDDELYNATCRAGVDFNSYKDIPVQCSGYDDANTDIKIKKWRDIENLHDDLKDKIVMRMGWKIPTPIQMRAVPLLIEGRDIMGCAQTGSGKTGAFSVPIVNALLNNGVGDGQDASDDGEDRTCCRPTALVCAPTRELAQQIQRDFVKLSKDTEIKCEYVVGGHAVRNQLEKIEGSHIIVATPGRLNDFVGKGKIKLDKLKYLVIDEADRMLEMGFQTIIEALALKMPDKEERTTAMFSATFPDEVQKIGHKFLRENYVFVAIGIVGCAANTVKQEIIEIGGDVNKEDKLMDLLVNVKENGEKTVIFVETKRMADYLATKLCSQDYPATSIHGDREQREREEALRTFRNGEHPILVATNVAARGIDIPEVMHVINHDLPKDIDEYVHRIGRTGRCGNIGRATSFYKSQYDKEKAARLSQILEQSNHEVPEFIKDDCDEGFGGTTAEAGAEESDDGW